MSPTGAQHGSVAGPIAYNSETCCLLRGSPHCEGVWLRFASTKKKQAPKGPSILRSSFKKPRHVLCQSQLFC